MKPILSFLLLIVLYALGVGVSLFAIELSQTWKYIILFISFIVSATLYYIRFYRPTVISNDKYLERTLDFLFTGFETTYRDAHPGNYSLRINIMRVRNRFILFGPNYAKISFFRGDYSRAEREQEFFADQGCCGIAMSSGQQCIYDQEQIPEAYDTLTHTQRHVTEHVMSILSTPIYRPSDRPRGQPVAILNIDSADVLGVNGFDRLEIQALVDSFADDVLGPYL